MYFGTALYLFSFGILCIQALLVPDAPLIWDTLGPFPAGMREIVADPLNAYGTFFFLHWMRSSNISGGIFQLNRADNSTYPSELGIAGLIFFKALILK